MTWDANVKEMTDTWTSFQKQMWAFWLGKTTDDTPEQPWSQCYKQSMELSEAMVNMMVDTQSAMTRIFLKGLNPGSAAPTVITQYFDQIESMAENWNEALHKTSSAWFTAVKDLDRMRAAGELPEAGNIFKAWQDATEKTLAIQSDWAAQMMPSDGPAEPKSKGVPRKKPAAPNTTPKTAP